MPERRESSYWRQVSHDHITGDFQGTIEIVTLPNPGEEPILKFHGRYHWHKPLIDETGTVIGHEQKWSLVPPQYDPLLKQRGIVGNKT